MDEIIVRLCRAIASYPRLRILSYLAQHGETMPTVLQRDLHLPLNVLSEHLRILSSIGLISSRRSAARCHYDFRSPYPENTLSGGASCWLKGLLRKGAATVSDAFPDGRSRSSVSGATELHTVIFAAATAFTDLRRLQILKYLEMHGQASGQVLAAQLRMSGVAACRQTAKLCRRGILSTRREGKKGFVFQLAAQPTTAVHAQLLEIVRAFLKKDNLRTSRSP